MHENTANSMILHPTIRQTVQHLTSYITQKCTCTTHQMVSYNKVGFDLLSFFKIIFYARKYYDDIIEQQQVSGYSINIAQG